MTLIETLVVVALIAIMLTLGTAATVQAKESAARIRRQVWLKQRIDRDIIIGTTRKNYEAQMEWFRKQQ